MYNNFTNRQETIQSQDKRQILAWQELISEQWASCEYFTTVKCVSLLRRTPLYLIKASSRVVH